MLNDKLLNRYESLFPDSWETYAITGKAVAISLEPDRIATTFRANVALQRGERGNLQVREAEELFGDEFAMYRLIDLQCSSVGSNYMVRRLGEYVATGGVPVTLEQWMMSGYVLTGSVDTARYAEFADFFVRISAKLLEPDAVGDD